MEQNESIINGIIFRSYTGKEVTIKWEGGKTEIDEALANDYIDEELDVRWGKTKELRRVKEALDNVSRFIERTLKSDFYEAYEENFDAPIEIANKKFWEEVFEVSISFT